MWENIPLVLIPAHWTQRVNGAVKRARTCEVVKQDKMYESVRECWSSWGLIKHYINSLFSKNI